jgi:hypothetical protein
MRLRKIEVYRWSLPEKRLKLVPAEAGNAFPTDKAPKHEAVDSKRTAAAQFNLERKEEL